MARTSPISQKPTKGKVLVVAEEYKADSTPKGTPEGRVEAAQTNKQLSMILKKEDDKVTGATPMKTPKPRRKSVVDQPSKELVEAAAKQTARRKCLRFSKDFLQTRECNVAFATQGVNKREVCPNKEEVKKIKAEGKLYSYFCEKHRQKHPDCPQLSLWRLQTGGKQEMEDLLKLAPSDFTDFISGKWKIDPPNLKDPWLHFDVLVQNQSFINRRSRVYTAKYLKPSKSRVELFTQKATVAQLEKAGTLDLSSTDQFWNSALPMIDEISVTKKWPIYAVCYLCEQHGHKHPDCPELSLWKLQTDIQNSTVPFWIAAPSDFTDFISCIEKAFRHCSPYSDGVLIRPKWKIDPPNLGGPWPRSDVDVQKQKFIKRHTVDYQRP
ncbi:hypothetical protein DAPPUDRAFT_103845 [Daphnia pulex]|uniref:CCHC-type domain-containing protein n=1 Tax=Daphnia pulex TaxID=6669 RepID=E9GKI6_DAPPU|nr:hypothetical protein DAPPUDRAFT_103845 [Daphnia pulex]|eukprot:EFX80000.1 hypothetical protein DAPPUDRAFT_103845 [Daphnia pulex]